MSVYFSPSPSPAGCVWAAAPSPHDWLLLPAISSKSDKTESKQTKNERADLSHFIAATLSRKQEAFSFPLFMVNNNNLRSSHQLWVHLLLQLQTVKKRMHIRSKTCLHFTPFQVVLFFYFFPFFWWGVKWGWGGCDHLPSLVKKWGRFRSCTQLCNRSVWTKGSMSSRNSVTCQICFTWNVWSYEKQS